MPQVFNRLRDLALEQGIIEPEQGRKPDCKLQYYVNDESVRKSAFASLHFMGTNPRLATLLKAVFEGKLAAPIDVRHITKKPGTTPSPKSGEVYSYLESLYHSVAESLPDDTEADFKPHHVAAPESDDELAEQANIIIRGGNRSTLGSLKDSGVRYLPPGSLYDQHKQYLALEFPHVSFNTFISVWKKDFPNLQFRGKRQHAICATCTRHRLLIKALPVTARLKQRLLYERHLADQYHDRQQYWQIRAASRTTAQNVAQNVGCENRTLALIIDFSGSTKIFMAPSALPAEQGLWDVQQTSTTLHCGDSPRVGRKYSGNAVVRFFRTERSRMPVTHDEREYTDGQHKYNQQECNSILLDGSMCFNGYLPHHVRLLPQNRSYTRGLRTAPKS